MSINTKAVTHAINILTALKAQFKVIMPDGTEYGELPVAITAPPPKRGAKYGYGVLTSHVEKYVSSVAVGESAIVPYGIFDAADVKNSVRSYVSKRWGNASWVIDSKESALEILRVL